MNDWCSCRSPLQDLAAFGLRRFAKFVEYLFEALDVLLGLFAVLLEDLLQLLVRFLLGELIKRGDQFLIASVDVLPFVVEQLIKRIVLLLGPAEFTVNVSVDVGCVLAHLSKDP